MQEEEETSQGVETRGDVTGDGTHNHRFNPGMFEGGGQLLQVAFLWGKRDTLPQALRAIVLKLGREVLLMMPR